jgi:hypothetical protein
MCQGLCELVIVASTAVAISLATTMIAPAAPTDSWRPVKAVEAKIVSLFDVSKMPHLLRFRTIS